MPPIAVHIDSPTIATKAQGVTPQPAEDASPTSTTDVTATTTTTSAPPETWVAEAGQAAAPEPTPFLPMINTAPPTRTSQLGENAPPRPVAGAGPRRRSYVPYIHASSLPPPPPQPGAVPQPAAVSRRTSQYSPPTPTTSLPPPPPPGTISRRTSQYAPPTPTGSMPPSPQMGVVLPRRTSQYAPANGYSSLSPPPKAGELGVSRKDSQQPSGFTGALHQMHVPPPPQVNWAPTYSTAIATGPTTSQRSSVTSLGTGPMASAPISPVSGPPGYRQDCYAQEMTAAQRASLDMEVRRQSLTAQLEVRRKSFAHTLGFTSEENSGEVLAGGPMGNAARGSGDAASGDMWGMAKGWWSAASTKLAATEDVVWKKVNGY